MFKSEFGFGQAVKDLFGTRPASVTFKGDAANNVVQGFMAPAFASCRVISDEQVAKVKTVDDLRREAHRGYRKTIGILVEDANGNRTTVMAEPEEQEQPTQAEKAEVVVETPVEKETLQVKPEDLYRKPPKTHTAKGQSERVKTKPVVKASDEDLVFNRMFKETKIDLDLPKRKWPNEVKSRIQEKTWAEFTSTHCGKTGYYETLLTSNFGMPVGTVMRGTDHKGRKMLIIVGEVDSEFSNIITFRRYSPVEVSSPYVANIPDNVVRLFQVNSAGGLSHHELSVLFGQLDPNTENLYARFHDVTQP